MYKLSQKATVYQFYIRGIFFSKKFLKKKNKQTLIFLRSPKHFNIGKRKVLAFNNNYNYNLNINLHINLLRFFKNKLLMYYLLISFFKLNLLYRINSIRFKTKIYIKW